MASLLLNVPQFVIPDVPSRLAPSVYAFGARIVHMSCIFSNHLETDCLLLSTDVNFDHLLDMFQISPLNGHVFLSKLISNLSHLLFSP